MLTAEQIKAIRLAKGMTPTELAARVGVCENTVRRWEIGDRRPRGASLILLHQMIEEMGGIRKILSSARN